MVVLRLFSASTAGAVKGRPGVELLLLKDDDDDDDDD
jgi:hypothetical protein